MTVERQERTPAVGIPDREAIPAGGIWTLSDGGARIIDSSGPLTLLVPGEAVRLLVVDLPLSSRAKRLQALPFAIEDRIAEPLDTVHLALGAEVAAKRYLVGVVRHDRMSGWVAAADAAGLGAATMLPDSLTLPVPEAGQWSVEVAGARALVRADDSSGFAVPTAMLAAAWRAAGSPQVRAAGDPLPEVMAAGALELGPLAERVAAASFDLRQGDYARRRVRTNRHFGRRLAWIVGIGAAAHATIAAADTLMLRAIADRRAEETRQLVALNAPGAALGDDLAASVADLLPPPGAGGRSNFIPVIDRVSAALQPLANQLSARSIRYEANALVIDLDADDPALSGQVDAALKRAGIPAMLTPLPGGGVRVKAGGA